MHDIFGQFRAAHQTNVNYLLQCAGVAAAGAEKLFELQMKTAKGRFAGAVKHIESVCTAKSAQAMAQLNTAMVQPAVENFASYSRTLHEVITHTQVELNTLFEERVAELNKHAPSVFDEAVEGAAAGYEVPRALATPKKQGRTATNGSRGRASSR